MKYLILFIILIYIFTLLALFKHMYVYFIGFGIIFIIGLIYIIWVYANYENVKESRSDNGSESNVEIEILYYESDESSNSDNNDYYKNNNSLIVSV